MCSMQNAVSLWLSAVDFFDSLSINASRVSVERSKHLDVVEAQPQPQAAELTSRSNSAQQTILPADSMASVTPVLQAQGALSTTPL